MWKYLLTLLLAGSVAAQTTPPLGSIAISGSRVPGWVTARSQLPDTSGWTVTSVPAASCADVAAGDPDAAGIIAAIAAASPNTILMLDANCTYNVGGTITFGTGVNNIVIRGHGRGSTIIKRRVDAINGPTFQVGSGVGSLGTDTDWTAGFTQGTKTFRIDDDLATVGLAVGDYVRMKANLPDDQPDARNPRGEQLVAKIVSVTNAVGAGNDTITVNVGLPYDFTTGGQVIAEVENVVRNIGFENFKIFRATPAADELDDSLIRFVSAAECWVTGLELGPTWNMAIGNFNGGWNYIAGNIFLEQQKNTDFDKGQVRNRTNTSGNQIENNAFLDTDVACEFENGTAYNICAYNYQTGAGADARCERSIFWHNDYAANNLAEGNDVEGRIEFDTSNGGSGPYNTVYRNRIRDNCTDFEGAGNNGRLGTFLGVATSRHDFTNIIANHVRIMTGANGATTNHDDAWLGLNVWRLTPTTTGCVLSNNAGSIITSQCGNGGGTATNTTWVAGFNGDNPDPSWTNLTFPPSLYLSGTPDWWCSESGTFPSIGAPSDTVGAYTKLPAQIMAEGGVCTPAVPTAFYACDCQAGAEGGCVAGSDVTGQGTATAPWQSYDKLQDQVATMTCGDSFNFCRGGKWTAVGGSADWTRPGLSCTGNPILVQSYHPPSTNFVAKPKIQLAAHATTFNFDDTGNNIWLQNLDLTCSGACTAGANGTVLAATGDAIKLDAMVFDGWTTGLEVSAGTIPNVINNVFRNNDVRAILANPGTGSVFNNNTFTNNSCLTGGTCSAEQPVLLTCTTVGECTRTVTVTNNTFTDNTMDPTAAPAGACNGNTLSLRGGTFVVEDNHFSLTDTSLTTGACENVRIGSITAGEPEQECVDCLFRRNHILGGNVGLAIQSWKDGGDSDTWGGIIENNIIILPENTSSTTFAANISGRESDNGGIDNANTLIRNNSMIIGDNASAPAGADSAAFDLRDNTGTYVVRNNTIRIDGLGENVCFKYASNANLADRIDTDFNLCDRLADSATNGWGALGGAPTTLAAFHAVDADTDDDQSWDTQSGFVGLSPDWDMHLVPDVVQLIGFPFFGQFVTLEIDGGGDPNNFSPQDIDGLVRPLGNPLGLGFVPDIGAYEAVPIIPVGR